jgi:hypothetical protein
MPKWGQSNRNQGNLPATLLLPRPGDFSLGSIKSRAAARAIPSKTIELENQLPDRITLTPFEAAISEHDDPRVSAVLVGLAMCAEERARVFGFNLPTPEWIRHQLQVAKLADRLCGGQFSQICSSDRDEGKRLRALAEDQIQGKLKGG